VTPRACGDCRACCSVLGVPELPKAPYDRCAHECDKGCGIYARRPEVCAGYECLWLVETNPRMREEAPSAQVFLLKEEERPDKSGLLFELSSINRTGSDFEKVAGIPFLTVREVRPGAFKGYWGQKVLKRLSKHALIIRVYQDGRRSAIGPPAKLRVFAQYVQHRLETR
jgi:hypothetical protein